MASACFDKMTMSPAKYTSYGRLGPKELPISMAEKAELLDLEASSNDFADFQFCLDDQVKMLPADELFSNGKLMPLHLSSVNQAKVTSPDTPKLRRRQGVSAVTDPNLFSPRAPRCSSRWKEILGLRRLSQREKEINQKPTLYASTKSLKSFLNRNSKSSVSSSLDSSLNLPLLKDSDTESLSVSSSRASLSSSSSGHEHDDLPRLSLDSDNKPSNNQRGSCDVKSRRYASSTEKITTGVRVGRGIIRREQETNSVTRGVSVESPRMNSSGKIVFHSLERSSSTPTSQGGGGGGCGGGGARYKNRGMERSYSANVRVTRVLNVPVGSLRGSSSSKSGGVFGFPLFSSSQSRKEGGNRNHQNLHQKNSNKNRMDKLTESKQ